MLYLVPQPKKIEAREGFFHIDPAARIVLAEDAGHGALESAQALNDTLRETAGFELIITKSQNTARPGIRLDIVPGEREGYTLSVSAAGVAVVGGGEAGLFYGVTTLRQMILQCGTRLPYADIEDKPYFEHRGF